MITNLQNQTDLSGLYFIYRGSTNLEEKGNYGISHLLEHLKCEAFVDLRDELQTNGISWNAYTSDNLVVFYFTGLEEYLATFRDTLIERMYKPFDEYLNENLFLKEKKIVLEEYGDCFSDQTNIFIMNLARKRFGHYSPIGLRVDLENLTFSDLRKFYEKQYVKPDQIVSISKSFFLEGDFEFENRKNIKKTFSEDLEAPLEAIDLEFPDKLSMAFYREVSKNDIPLLKIVMPMLGGGLNSPLYQELREKRGLCYSISNMLDEMGDKFYIFMFLSTTPDNEEVVTRTIDSVFSEKEKHMTNERFELIRKNLIINKKKSAVNRQSNINDILDENTAKLNDIIETVTFAEIMEVYDKYFQPGSFEKETDRNLINEHVH